MSIFEKTKIFAHKLDTAKSSVGQIDMASAYLEAFAKQLANTIAVEASNRKWDTVSAVKLPWGYELLVSRYGSVLRCLNDTKSYARLISDIDAGWLDRVDAMFDAKTKTESNRICREWRSVDASAS